ncbi:MAG: CehA/McbA family metallohydrolase [Gemmatimonadetes bacterium]|nr:CehA/McbA family metallohydrolase [Gemmatimonadota bacterium]
MLKRNAYPAICAALLLIAAWSVPSGAHNGSVAFAGPIDGITVDGDLSDWPEGLQQYSIVRVESGSPMEDANDFSGSFRMGHSLSEGKLYLAIEVEDQSTFIDTASGNWDASDGCEVYLDVHGPHGHFDDSNPLQYAIAGVTGRDYGHNIELPAYKGVVERTGTHYVYEWELDLQGRGLQDVVGFDIAVLDRDADGSFSWISWGSQISKASSRSHVGDLQLVTDVASARMDWNTSGAQALVLHVNRLRTALDYLGSPLPDETTALLDSAVRLTDGAATVRLIRQALEPHCLMTVNINPESRVKAAQGQVAPVLIQKDWQQFLVRVYNQAGVTAPLAVSTPEDDSHKWIDARIHTQWPMQGGLSGLELDYRLIQIYSHEAGKRAAVLSFDVGQGTQDLGFRSDVTMTFEVQPRHLVTLGVRDDKGEPTIAAFIVRDQHGRIYPSQADRLPPDFAFHPQVYRGDGESLYLPTGEYTFEVSRGPECLPQTRTVVVGDGPSEQNFDIEQGRNNVRTIGEDLKIGAALTWGPGFDYQKQFFTGAEDVASKSPYLIRYDVEVSGFGSHQSGHLCLLGLSSQIPPGGDSKHHWPTLGLNTLKWAQAQGAVAGPAHSGWGMRVDTDELPNYQVPGYDGIGANEYIVDVTHQVPGPDGALVPAVDFLSMCDTPPVWELNVWYHTLNTGFRTRVSGETDFPCIYGERVGLGRSYVQIDGEVSYAKWVAGVTQGRAYVSDGRSHLLDFQVGDTPMGQRHSEVRLSASGRVTASASVAALLDEQIDQQMDRSLDSKPYWHIEKARKDSSRQVLVELIVNGHAVAEKAITADGALQDVSFDVDIERSSWVAMRIFPSSHTNPVFVIVDDKPIRASTRSAQWCLDSVDKCWSQKERFIDQDEMDDALAAYEHARVVYRNILAESLVD